MAHWAVVELERLFKARCISERIHHVKCSTEELAFSITCAAQKDDIDSSQHFLQLLGDTDEISNFAESINTAKDDLKSTELLVIEKKWTHENWAARELERLLPRSLELNERIAVARYTAKLDFAMKITRHFLLRSGAQVQSSWSRRHSHMDVTESWKHLRHTAQANDEKPSATLA